MSIGLGCKSDFELPSSQANILAGLVSFLQNPLLDVLRNMDGAFLLPLLAQLGLLVTAVRRLFKLLNAPPGCCHYVVAQRNLPVRNRYRCVRLFPDCLVLRQARASVARRTVACSSCGDDPLHVDKLRPPAALDTETEPGQTSPQSAKLRPQHASALEEAADTKLQL